MKTSKNLSLALGAAVAVVATTPALAADNPFAMQKLDGGYQLAQADMKKADDKKKDGKCGEGKCGAEKKAEPMKEKMADKKKDGSCGGDKKKDGSCGGDKK